MSNCQSGESLVIGWADRDRLPLSALSSGKEFETFTSSTWQCDVLRQCLLGLFANALGFDAPVSTHLSSSLLDAAPPYHRVGHDVPPAYVEQDNKARYYLDQTVKKTRIDCAVPGALQQPLAVTDTLAALDWGRPSNIRTCKKKRPAKKSTSNGTYRTSGHADDNREYRQSGFNSNTNNNNGQSAGRSGSSGIGGSGGGRPPGEGGDPFGNRSWDMAGRKVKSKKQEEEEEEEEEERRERAEAAARAREVVERARRPRQPLGYQGAGYEEGRGYARPPLPENMAPNVFPEPAPSRGREVMQDPHGAREPLLTLNTQNLPTKNIMSNPPSFLDEDPNSSERYGEHPSATDGQSIMGTNSAFGAFDFGGFGPPSAHPRSQRSFPIEEERFHMAEAGMPQITRERSPSPEFHSQRESPEIFEDSRPKVISQNHPEATTHDDKLSNTLGEELESHAHRGRAAHRSEAGYPNTNHWNGSFQPDWGDDEPAGDISLDDLNRPSDRSRSRIDPDSTMHGDSFEARPESAGQDVQSGNEAADKSSSSEYEEPVGGLWGFFGATKKKKKDKSMALGNLSSSPNQNEASSLEDRRSLDGTDMAKVPSASPDDRRVPTSAININRPYDDWSEKDSRRDEFSPDDHQLWMEQAGRDNSRPRSRSNQPSPFIQLDVKANPEDINARLDRSKVHKYPAARVDLQGLANDLGQRKRRPSTHNLNQISSDEIPPPLPQTLRKTPDEIPPPLPQTFRKTPDDPWVNPWQSSHHGYDEQTPHTRDEQQYAESEIPPIPAVMNVEDEKPPIQKTPVRSKSKIRIRPPPVDNSGPIRPKPSRNKSVTPELEKQGSVNTIDRESLKNSDRTSTRSRGLLPNQWGAESQDEDQVRPSILGEPLNMFNVPSFRPPTRGMNSDQEHDGRPRRGTSRASSRISPDDLPIGPKTLTRGEQEKPDYDWLSPPDQDSNARPQSRMRSGTMRGNTISKRTRPALPVDAPPDPPNAAPPLPAEPRFPMTKRKSILRMNPERERPTTRAPRRGELSSAASTRYLSRERPRNITPPDVNVNRNSSSAKPRNQDEERHPEPDLRRRPSQRNAISTSRAMPSQPSKVPLAAQPVPEPGRQSSASSEKESNQPMEEEVPQPVNQAPDRRLTSPPSAYNHYSREFGVMGNPIQSSPQGGNPAKPPRDSNGSRTLQAQRPLSNGAAEENIQRAANLNPWQQPFQPHNEPPLTKLTRPESRELPSRLRESRSPYEGNEGPNDSSSFKKNVHELDQPSSPKSPIRADESRKPRQAHSPAVYPDVQPIKARQHASMPEREVNGKGTPQDINPSREVRDQLQQLSPPADTNIHSRQRRRGSLMPQAMKRAPFPEPADEFHGQHPSPSSPKAASPVDDFNHVSVASPPRIHHSSRQNTPVAPEEYGLHEGDMPDNQLLSPRRRKQRSRIEAPADHKDRDWSQPTSPVAREPDDMNRRTTQDDLEHQHTRATSHRRSQSKENLRRFKEQLEEKLRERPDSERVRMLEKHINERLGAVSPSQSESSSEKDEFVGSPHGEEPREEPEPIVEQPPQVDEEPKQDDKPTESKPQASTGLIGSIWGLVKMGAGQQKPPELPTDVAESEKDDAQAVQGTNDDAAIDEVQAEEEKPQAEIGPSVTDDTPQISQNHGLPSKDQLAEQQTPLETQPVNSQTNLHAPQKDERNMQPVNGSSVSHVYSDRKRQRPREMAPPTPKKRSSASKSRRDARVAPTPTASQDLAQPVRETVAGDPHIPADTTASRKVRQHHNNLPSSSRHERPPSTSRARRHMQPGPRDLVSAREDPAYSSNVPIEEAKLRRSSSRPAKTVSKSGEEGQRSLKPQRKPSRHRSNPMSYQPAYVESEASSPRRRSLSTWELSDTDSEPGDQDDVPPLPPPPSPPPPPESAVQELKPSHVPSEAPSTARKYPTRKPTTGYNVPPPNQAELQQPERPRTYVRTRAQPLETQPIRRQPSYDEYDHGSAQQDSPSGSEDYTSQEEHPVTKPLVGIPTRTKSMKDRASRPEIREKPPRKSKPVEILKPLVIEEEDPTSDEVPVSSPIEPPEVDRPSDRQPRERRSHRPRPQLPMAEPDASKHEYHDLEGNEPRPLHRSSTLPAARMGGILGSLWNNIRRPKADEPDHPASDDETRRQPERTRGIPRRTQSHRHRRPVSEIPSPVHKTDPEQEASYGPARDPSDARAERKARRRESRERHRLRQEADERAADLKRIEAERARQQEDEEARKAAEKRARKRALQAKRHEEEELSRQRLEDREARRTERSVRKERRRTQDREESAVRSHRRRHSLVQDNEMTGNPPERSSRRRHHQGHSDNDAGDTKLRQRGHHRSVDAGDRHRTPRSKHRKRDHEPMTSPAYPSAGPKGNEKTASWVKSQHTDPPEPPPVVPTLVDDPGGEGHTISSDEEVRKSLRRQARRRKKYGDMTDEEIEQYRARRRMEREQTRNPEPPGHQSDGIPGKVGKWFKKFSK
ncbi:hypothetical protein KEM56_000202 [Ascosphaera pollenicola]|nr:hypothetical protein KEM56_000202 [Ascosphaera pollenicola]